MRISLIEWGLVAALIAVGVVGALWGHGLTLPH